MANSKDQRKKSNKGNFTFPTYRVNVIELESNKKVATLSISTSTPLPPFQVYPPFLAKSQFLEGPTPLSLIRGVGEGSNYELQRFF